MLKKLLFVTSAFALLAASVLATPEPATALHCNNWYCNEQYNDCWGLMYSHCIDSGFWCGDDMCVT